MDIDIITLDPLLPCIFGAKQSLLKTAIGRGLHIEVMLPFASCTGELGSVFPDLLLSWFVSGIRRATSFLSFHEELFGDDACQGRRPLPPPIGHPMIWQCTLLSSGAWEAKFLRSPYDLINMATFMGWKKTQAQVSTLYLSYS